MHCRAVCLGLQLRPKCESFLRCPRDHRSRKGTGSSKNASALNIPQEIPSDSGTSLVLYLHISAVKCQAYFHLREFLRRPKGRVFVANPLPWSRLVVLILLVLKRS